MTLYVYDKALQRAGIVEDIRSLQWLEEYQDAGEAKLVCSATEKNRALLADGNRRTARSRRRAPLCGRRS